MRSLCPGICFSEIKLTSAVWLLEANVETGSRLEAVSKHPEGVEGRKLRDLTVTATHSESSSGPAIFPHKLFSIRLTG